MPKLLIVDDHPLFREALCQTVQQAFDGSTVLEAGSIDETITTIHANGDIDLVLLDLNIPGAGGFAGLLSLRTSFPKLPVVVVSGVDDNRVVAEALSYGAIGFIPKTTARPLLKEAIDEVLAGGVFLPPGYRDAENSPEPTGLDGDLAARLASLTPQQFRVLKMLSDGKLNKQIAYELNVGETTVKAHVSAILRKLRVHSRTQAVIQVRNLDFDTLLGEHEHRGTR